MNVSLPNHSSSRILVACLAMLFAANVYAHVETGVAGGLLSGLLHPVTGLDHLVAMVAVGIWGAQLGRPAIWILPITFPMIMALGGLLGLSGLPIPGALVEVGIALSAVTLGVLIALRLTVPLWAAVVIVSVFALCHGHAHGTELPSAVNALAYGAGFVVATGLLHLCGILLGELHRFKLGVAIIRALGVIIALLGFYFLSAHLI
jgi:urease accessory protein